MLRIDSHHHLWRYTAEEYGWIDNSMGALRCDFLLEELRLALESASIAATVAVQARQTLEETKWLLELSAPAYSGSPVAGVVGWLPLASPHIGALLEEFRPHKALKGLRHVVQAEPAGFLDGDEFNRGVRALRGTGLVYDLLIFASQIREATRFVDRHPDQAFVLDHIAKPAIRAGEIAQWSADIRDLARRPNIVCKLSGMVTEANPEHWSREELTPYFEVVLEAFGPDRMMVGSDWPVLTVGCTYARWWDIVERWIAPLSTPERASILGRTASRVYGLQVDSSSAPLQESNREAIGVAV